MGIKSSIVPGHRIHFTTASAIYIMRWIYNVIVYLVSTIQQIWPQVADDSNTRPSISYNIYRPIDTVRCRYNAHNFLEKPHNWYVIARPLVRGMGFLLWVQIQIYVMPKSLWCCMLKTQGVILKHVVRSLPHEPLAVKILNTCESKRQIGSIEGMCN